MADGQCFLVYKTNTFDVRVVVDAFDGTLMIPVEATASCRFAIAFDATIIFEVASIASLRAPSGVVAV